VARPTRSQRRARREAREQSLQRAANGAATPAAPPPPVAVAPAARVDRPRRGTFLHESWSELRKVEWPGQTQVVQGMVVVLIAMIVVGLYLYVCDSIFNKLVQHVILK